MGSKYNQRPTFKQGPDWQDIGAALAAVEQDLGLHTHLRIASLETGGLVVVCEVFQKVNGERIGVSRHERPWDGRDNLTFEGAALAAIHYAYNRAWELVFNPNTTNGRTRR